jgi:hypothetical protein
MTIERVLRSAARVSLVLAGWAAIMAAMPFVGPTGRTVALVGDPGTTTRIVLAAGGTIVERRGRAILARSDRPGFAAALYREGAALVLEGRVAAGCFTPRAR